MFKTRFDVRAASLGARPRRSNQRPDRALRCSMKAGGTSLTHGQRNCEGGTEKPV